MSSHHLPPPAPHPIIGRAVPLTSIEELGASFGGFEGRIEQTSQGRFDGSIRFVMAPRVRIMTIEGNQCLRAQGRDASGMFSAFLEADEKSVSLWQGRQLTHRQVSACGIDTEMDHFTGRRLRSLGVFLSPEVLQDAARVLLHADDVPVSKTWTMVSPPPEIFNDLQRRLSGFLDSGVANPSMLSTPEGAQWEQECIQSLVAALYSGAAPQPPLSLPARLRLLSRAEEFMRSRLSDPVSAIDLCREFGVSERTLRLAFRDRYGLGPMVYYKYLRLNAVRSRLMSDRDVTIAAAAREFGFHHLGNFASDYRRLFGMRPSETDR